MSIFFTVLNGRSISNRVSILEHGLCNRRGLKEFKVSAFGEEDWDGDREKWAGTVVFLLKAFNTEGFLLALFRYSWHMIN